MSLNFDYPAAAEAFRRELRAFIAEELPSWWTNFLVDDERAIPFTREFCRKLGARGWFTMAWPKEHGGSDADVWHQNVLREEMWAVGEPRGSQYMNINFIGPAIMMFGTDEQKARYLPPMAAGDVIWCQGFSERNAGSDLANLEMRAEDTGSGFKLNGTKVWVSYATHAKHCILLARTDPSGPKHTGISMFVVDMDTPGIRVRAGQSMVGPLENNDVFFEDAEVPYDALVGPRDQGWHVAMSALERERAGLAYGGRTHLQLEELARYAQETHDSAGRPLSERADVRGRIVRLRALTRAQRLIMNKTTANQRGDDSTLVDAAIYKVLGGETTLQAAQLAMELAGPRASLLAEDPGVALSWDGAYAWWVRALPVQVAAGSSEIQRNIIAQRGLGLPRG